MSRESHSGFHVYSCFQECRRKFWFKYLLKWTTIHTSKALIFGGCIHKAMEFYFKNNFTKEGVIEVFQNEMNNRQNEYEKEEDYFKDSNRGFEMLNHFLQTWADDDKKRYKVLSVEQEEEVKLEDYILTFKPDVVLEDKYSGSTIIMDHKTTSFSVNKSFENLLYSEQPTMYLFGWNENHPKQKADGMLPNILYQKGKVISAERPSIIGRTKGEIEGFKLNMYQIITDLTELVANYKEYPVEQLFGKNLLCDGPGFYTCEFKPICRLNLDYSNPPIGYKINTEEF